MINVCSQCFRLNPLDRQRCHYCQGECEKIHALAFSHFRLSCQNGGKTGRKETMEEIEQYPDVLIFADCRNQADEEMIFARP